MLWHIPVAPRVKYFIWLCLHGHLTTAVLLHQLNLGPDSVCIFCGLQRETVDHLFGGCANTQQVWNFINHIDNLSISWSSGFSSRDWIIKFQHSKFNLALIAAGSSLYG